MKLNFRQGLISFQKNSSSSPLFLVPSSTSGYFDLNIAPTPLVATIAHLDADYLLSFETSVHNAFGPLVSGVDNYLFIEVDVLTGATHFGITTREPIVSSVMPASPAAGQTWFDLNTTQTFVRNPANTKFVPSPRVFLGKVVGGNVNSLIHRDVGSQAGLNVPSSPGFFMLDEQLRPLRSSTGTLLTTQSSVRVKTTQGSSGVLTTPTSAFIPVRAAEAIPAMSLVYFTAEDTVELASSNPGLQEPQSPIGIVQLPLAQNEVGALTLVGEITYDQWNWASETFGKPLYCGNNGELITTRPAGLQVFRVGVVKNAKTILFSIDSETTPQVYAALGAIIHGQAPIVATQTTNSFGENVTTISIAPATSSANGYMTSAQATALGTFDARITTNAADIDTLEAGKSNVGHTHIPSNIVGLQTLLDGKMNVNANFDDRYAPININFDSRYALINHTHSIAQVNLLQTALDGKANTTHTHIVSDVTGLQTLLDGKANTTHTHIISQVTGLQTALDGKSNVGHTHSFDQVPGLQQALDDKSNVGHTQDISTINGLQTALNNKAAVNHNHALTSLSDVSSSAALINDYVLVYDSLLGKFTTAPNAGGGSATALAALSDVNFASAPVQADLLSFNGVDWEAKAPFEVSGALPVVNSFVPTNFLAFTGTNVVVSEPTSGTVEVHINDTDLSGYLPLTGGTLSGDLLVPVNAVKAALLQGQTISTFDPNVDPDGLFGFVEIHNNGFFEDRTGRIEFHSADGNIRGVIGNVDENYDMRYVANNHQFDGNVRVGDGDLDIGKGQFHTAVEITRGASILIYDDAGTEGQVLTSTGPGNPVEWRDPSGGPIETGSTSTFSASPDILFVVNIPLDQIRMVTIMVTAIDQDSGLSAAFKLVAAAKSVSGGVALLAPFQIDEFKEVGTETWNVSTIENSGSSALDFIVIGEASRTIRWNYTALVTGGIGIIGIPGV